MGSQSLLYTNSGEDIQTCKNSCYLNLTTSFLLLKRKGGGCELILKKGNSPLQSQINSSGHYAHFVMKL
jgi:hypothetical protein